MLKPVVLLAYAAIAFGQATDPAYTELDQAYQALRAKRYAAAIAGFERAISLAPDRPSIRKDLAYALLKAGENDGAREQFAAAMRLDPGDESVALEYAFLCYETKREVTARRVFDGLRKFNPTAAEAFENIDRPLREGIARWRQALAIDPGNFSGHQELARLAEQRDELGLAAEHYEQAWRLRPAHRELLVDLGRIWQQQGRIEEAGAALLAASRGAEPRLAEQAREMLPARYPYVSEFEKALVLDPSNIELRRELGFLQLQLEHPAEADKQFESLVQSAPGDLLATAQLGLLRMQRGDDAGAMALLNRVLAGDDAGLTARVRAALRLPALEPRTAASGANAKELGAVSLEKGFLKDAVKYLTAAHENDALDFDVMLKLGWANNLLKNDQDAVKWFNLARRSPDSRTAVTAARAYRNLSPSIERFRTTVWMFPTFSSRWHDLFAYAQAKTELRLARWPVKPYASIRFVGDTNSAVSPGSGWAPQYLSEGAATMAAGVATTTWRGLMGWFEAGVQMRYRPSLNQFGFSGGDSNRISPDYRGGASYAGGVGHLLTQGAHGLFAETNDDLVYVRRFENDTLLYSQNRIGYTLRQPEAAFGGIHAQLYWNSNITADVKGLYWANTVEAGPGIRFQFARCPLLFSVNALRGVYLVNTGNPRGPSFTDLRVGVWYAFSR